MSEPTPPADASPKKGLPSAALIAVALVAGLAVGGAAGAFAVGPALAEGIAPAVAASGAHHARAKARAHDAEDGDSAGADDEEGEGDESESKAGASGKAGEPAASLVHTIDNLVLNPAESGGSRFLLFTIAFEMRDQALLDAIKARDAEMRDVVLATLGQRTTEQLADMTLRDSLKAQIVAVASKQLGKKRAVQRIYFPQFVIQ